MHGRILIVFIKSKTQQSSLVPNKAIDILRKLLRAMIYDAKGPLRYVQRVLVLASSKQLQPSNFTSQQLIAEGALLCSTPFKCHGQKKSKKLKKCWPQSKNSYFVNLKA